MVYISETIYPGDSDNGSLDFKLVRFARTFRAESITNPSLEARLKGYFATNPDYDSAKANAERAVLRGRMTDIENKLGGFGVPATAIHRVGVTQSSLSGGQIEVTTGSLFDLTLPFFPPPCSILPPTTPTVPYAPYAPVVPGGTRPTWLDYQGSEGSVTLDPKDKEIKTEVTITFKTNGVPGVKYIAVTLAVGADGQLKEVGTELTLYKKQLAESVAKGIVTDVQFAVKATAAYGLQKSEIEAKLKAVLSADIGVPGTQVKFGADLSAYTDAAGKPGVALNFTLFKF